MAFLNTTKTARTKRNKKELTEVLEPTAQPVVADVDPDKGEHLNYMGGRSYSIDDTFLILQTTAASCFFGEPQYYQSEGMKTPRFRDTGYGKKILDRDYVNNIPPKWQDKTPAERMVLAIDAALNVDVERTLRLAVSLRTEHKIRTTPQVIMVRAGLHPNQKGTGLVTKYAKGIIQRIDEVTVQYAYFLSLGLGHTPPKCLKRNWARAIERASTYQLSKYRMESREVSLVDVINITHPKGEDISKLVRGELKLNESSRRTWESIRSSGGSWKEAKGVMGHMAMLRNLRNLSIAGEIDEDFLKKFKASAEKGKQLPFRYLSAYNALKTAGGADTRTLDAIETCLENSMQFLPRLEGRVMSLVDNSGSAQSTTTSSIGTMTVASIGNLMGIITGKASDDGHLGVFGDRYEHFPVRKRSSVFDLSDKANQVGRGIGMGTEHGVWLFWKEAIEQRQQWDMVFIYSDMQAGHGGLYGTTSKYRVEGTNHTWNGSNYYASKYIDVAKLVETYRKNVNPKVHVVLCQIAGYQDTLIPDAYDRTYVLGGWSEQIIKYAAAMRALRDGNAQ